MPDKMTLWVTGDSPGCTDLPQRLYHRTHRKEQEDNTLHKTQTLKLSEQSIGNVLKGRRRGKGFLYKTPTAQEITWRIN